MRRMHKVVLAWSAIAATVIAATVLSSSVQAAEKHRDAAVTKAFAATTRATAWSLECKPAPHAPENRRGRGTGPDAWRLPAARAR